MTKVEDLDGSSRLRSQCRTASAMLSYGSAVVVLLLGSPAHADASDGRSMVELCMYRAATELVKAGSTEDSFSLARAATELCTPQELATEQNLAEYTVKANRVARLAGTPIPESVRWNGTASELMAALKEKAIPRVAARLIRDRATAVSNGTKPQVGPNPRRLNR